MKLTIDEFCNIIEGTIIQHGTQNFVSVINIYPVSFKKYDTFFAINSSKYTTSDCGFGNSGNEDSVFGLKGTQNTHPFIDSSIVQGATTIVFDDKNNLSLVQNVNYIYVKDSVSALAKYAHYCVSASNSRIIAVTGSTGKTTLTSSLINLLSLKYKVQTTEYIRITYIGLIWFIINDLLPDTDWIIIEMQIDGHGQIDRLCEVINIDVAYIINIGSAHLERFGTIEKILYEKLGVYRGLKPNGTLFVNDDCDVLNQWRLKHSGDSRIIPVRTKSVSSMIRNRNIHPDTFSFLLESCHIYDINDSDNLLIDSFDNSNLVGRFQTFSGINDSTVIVDTYNASLISTSYGLEKLSNHYKTKKILVLGSLLELGESSETVHRQIGKMIKNHSNIDFAIFIGESTIYSMDEIYDCIDLCKHVYTYQAALKELMKYGIDKDTVIYVKGSGAMRLELLALQLIGKKECEE